MLVHPRVDQFVQLWYAAAKRPLAPHHGQSGIVVAVGIGPGPRNHLVELHDGREVVVPCGNLRKPR